MDEKFSTQSSTTNPLENPAVEKTIFEIETEFPDYSFGTNGLYSSISSATDNIEDIMSSRGLETDDRYIVAGTDWDKTFDDPSALGVGLYPGVAKSLELYHELAYNEPQKVMSPRIRTGREVNFPKFYLEHMDLYNPFDSENPTDIIGEHGGVYSHKGENTTVETDLSEGIDAVFFRNMREIAAEENLKVIEGKSRSEGKGVVSVEGEGINLENPRTGISEDPFYSREYLGDNMESLDLVVDVARSQMGSKKARENIEMPIDGFYTVDMGDRDVSDGLHMAMTTLGSGAGLRYIDMGDTVGVYSDPTVDGDISLEEAQNYIDMAARRTMEETGTDMELEHHSDWWTDYRVRSSTTKEGTENILSEDIEFIDDAEEETLVLHAGDQQGDVFTQDNAVSFTVEGTEAEEYAEQTGIDHIKCKNATEVFLTASELAYRSLENSDPMFNQKVI